MQLKRTSRIVLSLTGQSIRYAKVHRAGQNVQVSDQKVLTFDFASFWSAPLTADNALSQLLKAHGISRNKVIIGVPAQWCLFDEIRLPKLDQASLKSAVGLQAEQRYNRSDRAFTCDYMSPVADDDMWSVTLGAMAASHVAALQFALEQVHLKVHAIIPTSVLLHDLYQTDASKRWQYTAWLRNDQVELFCWNHKKFAGMNLLSVSSDHLNGDLHQHLYDTVRQQIMQDELIHAVDAQNQNVQLFWDHEHDCDAQWFSKPTDARRWQIHDKPNAGRGATRVGNDLIALGQLVLSEETPTLDFADSRLHQKQTQTTHPWRNRLILIGSLVLILVGLLGYDLYSLNQQVSELNTQISELEDGTDRAGSIIKLVQRAENWFSTEPVYLNCQRSISRAFGSTEHIWASNLSLRPDMMGLMNGYAHSKDHIVHLIDRMKNQPDLSQIKLLYMRDSNAKNDTEIAYAISFVYEPAKATAKPSEPQATENAGGEQ
ncbi:MAG: hypothetical protein CMJ19_01340 [Phycisphaeraceae bacterium]|nr:hypothetical protein [Phycisphaeraceae bacterium]